jgi:hypothetical protein
LAENSVNVQDNIQPLCLSPGLTSGITPDDQLHGTYLIINIDKQLELPVEMQTPHTAMTHYLFATLTPQKSKVVQLG